MFKLIASVLSLSKPMMTTNAKCPYIKKFNGQIILSSPWAEPTLVNGQAIVGSKAQRICANQLFVVNGNLKANNTSFYRLEANGQIELSDCEIAGSAELYGRVSVFNSTLNELDLYGTSFHFKNTIINRQIRVKSPLGLKARIVLKKSIAKEGIVFESGMGEIIEVD